MLALASIFLGIIPMVLYALVVWRLDRWEKEPFHLLLIGFIWGAVPSIVFALISQLAFGLPEPDPEAPFSLGAELYGASFLAPLTEEFIKGCGVFFIFILFRREIDSVLDGLIYGSMIGFGFAAVENVFYFFGQPDPTSLIVNFIFRAFFFGMLHALFTGLTGVGFALGMFSRNGLMKMLWPLLGLGAAMITHAAHNFFATINGEFIILAIMGVSLGVIWFGVMVAVCLHHERRWIQIHLADEVAAQTLHAEQALDAANLTTRSTILAFFTGKPNCLKRRKLLNRATDLAYAKKRKDRLGGSHQPDGEIENLRREVKELSQLDPLVMTGVIHDRKLLPPPLPPIRRQAPPLPG
jgi:protease PrsW